MLQFRCFSDPVAERKQAVDYLVRVASRLRSSAPGPVTVRFAYGDASATIAAVAREADADAIAMATHGRGGWNAWSPAVSPCVLFSVPVLVYRPVSLRPTVLDSAVEKAMAT